jgi:ribosomal subunit interface protein
MTLIVESKRLKLTKALREFVSKQTQKLTKLGQQGATKVAVYLETVKKKSNDPTANSVTYALSLPGRKVIVVKKHAVDMYQAIVAASSEAFRKLRKVKERRLDSVRNKLKQ